jgi:hypothetical protein
MVVGGVLSAGMSTVGAPFLAIAGVSVGAGLLWSRYDDSAIGEHNKKVDEQLSK